MPLAKNEPEKRLQVLKIRYFNTMIATYLIPGLEKNTVK